MSELSETACSATCNLPAWSRGPGSSILWAVRQLAAYYMVSPDQLSERKVEDYLLYVRDELGVAKGNLRADRRRD